MAKEINVFEKASRLRTRFETSKGAASVEDMWVLPLAVVDQVAQALQAKIEAVTTKSFITKVSKSNEDDVFRLDILKHIITVRLEEHEEAQVARGKAERKRQLLALLEQREVEADQKLSKEDILKELETL